MEKMKEEEIEKLITKQVIALMTDIQNAISMMDNDHMYSAIAVLSSRVEKCRFMLADIKTFPAWEKKLSEWTDEMDHDFKKQMEFFKKNTTQMQENCKYVG